ncbi:MAG: TIM barrel protein [Bryobacteraceae bacterium]
MLRRAFLKSAAAIPLAASLRAAITGPIELGLNTYCLRFQKWNDRQLLEYTAGLKLDAVFLQDSLDPGTDDPGHWREVREHAKQLGLHLETGGGSILPKKPENFNASVKTLERNLERAAGMGSPLCRANLAGDHKGLPYPTNEQNIEAALKVLKAVRTRALDTGVKVAIEIHKDLQSWEHKQIIDGAGRDIAGTYLDTANPVYVAEDPMVAVETLGPYALTVHFRDSVIYEHPRGACVQWVPLGEGVVDFKKIVAKVREVCPPPVRIYVKPITGRPPDVIPYMEADFWKNYPHARAGEFARFLALAKAGRPYEKHVVIEEVPGRPMPAPFVEAMKFQQREHMERSVEYAKKVLDLGLRWR